MVQIILLLINLALVLTGSTLCLLNLWEVISIGYVYATIPFMIIGCEIVLLLLLLSSSYITVGIYMKHNKKQ